MRRRAARRSRTLRLLAALWLAACGGADDVPDAPPGSGPELVATRCEGAAATVDCAGGPRRSPFACLRFDDDCDVDVRLEDEGPWYRLEGVNGVALGGIFAVADAACAPEGSPGGDRLPLWKRKRLAEDLPALMEGVCAPLGETADLALRDLDTGEWLMRPGVPVTEAKRAATRLCWPRHDACGG